MPLEAPNLDNRRFTEIVEELRSRIPRYLPEWTDHNRSDPGITLIQLFGWLGEMMLYRLNQVPDRNYITFLQLIGVERKPAAPARAELTFSLVSPGPSTVIIPKGTRVGAKVQERPSAVTSPVLPQDEEKPIIFETDEPLNALGAVLDKVQVFDGVNFIDYTEENGPTGKTYPAFGSQVRDGNALMLGFALNAAFPAVELNLAVRVAVDPTKVRETSCDVSVANVPAPATTVWEYWNGAGWRKLDVIKDETRGLTSSGHLYCRGPKDAKKAKLGAFTAQADQELYWFRCRLVRSQYELPPELDAVLINTVRATAVVTVLDEVIGSSNGEPKQLFRLYQAPVFAGAPYPVEERLRQKALRRQPPTEAEQEVLDEALRERELIKGFLLEVDEGQGFKPWEEVEDFFNSGADDRHYILNRTTGDILFGDGEKGCIPVAGINNIVVRLYRYGGGSRSNVGVRTITDLQTGVAGVDTVKNYWPAEGGADEEPVEDTKARAPKELKARDRAVTVQDFEFLALQAPGVRVRRAHALPLYHPQFPGVDVPGVITVIVVPESKDPKPLPSEVTMQTVCTYLNQRRLLTAEVLVAPPKYKQVKIEARVLAKATSDAATVKASVDNALTTYLHPLTGGADRQGWPLGGPVLYSEVFRVVLNVEGVKTIEDLRIVIDGERKGKGEDAEIPRDFLVFSDGHEITVTFTPAVP
jgi:uncharacterized phage protein gp47/JayE